MNPMQLLPFHCNIPDFIKDEGCKAFSQFCASVKDKEHKDTKEVIIGLVTQLDLLSFIMNYEKRNKTATTTTTAAAKTG